MNVSLRDFRALVALAEERHFGRAANRLGLTQPQLSVLVKRLEQSFGVPLFKRRQVATPTPAGDVMVDAARHVLSEVEASSERAKEVDLGEAGLIRLGFASSAMLSGLPAALASFSATHPRIRFLVNELHSASLTEALNSSLVELAVSREPPGGSRLRCELLTEEALVLVDRSDGSGHQPVHPRELHERPLILFRREIAPCLYDQIYALASAGGTPEVAQQADEWHSIFGLVESGLGVTIAPAGLRKLAWQPLRVREIVPSNVAQMWMIWDPDSISAGGVKLVEHLRAVANGPEPNPR